MKKRKDVKEICIPGWFWFARFIKTVPSRVAFLDFSFKLENRQNVISAH